jgi:hypothetical protein
MPEFHKKIMEKKPGKLIAGVLIVMFIGALMFVQPNVLNSATTPIEPEFRTLQNNQPQNTPGILNTPIENVGNTFGQTQSKPLFGSDKQEPTNTQVKDSETKTPNEKTNQNPSTLKDVSQTNEQAIEAYTQQIQEEQIFEYESGIETGGRTP